MKHPKSTKSFNISNRKEFTHLWKALNGKMKKLKKDEIVSCHYNHLMDTELQSIFQHYAVANNTPQGLHIIGIHFKKYSQKNNQGGVDGNSDALIIPVLPDPEGSQGPIYDIKHYFSKRLPKSKCAFLHLKINTKIRMTCSILIQELEKKLKGVAMGTTISITGHKNESSYHIYARPSNKQKEDALSLLINSVRTLPSNSQKPEALSKNAEDEVIMDSKQQNSTIGGHQPINKSPLENSYENTTAEIYKAGDFLMYHKQSLLAMYQVHGVVIDEMDNNLYKLKVDQVLLHKELPNIHPTNNRHIRGSGKELWLIDGKSILLTLQT
ncbi:hypothetical protein C2G38_2208602 [Gigaspora rosea]|uniref:Uncharacterized protein n=1 Tax=Gigaspora rosea TaxID=44941 RepID=A0A397UQZ8_9GLOM|nr:hypothetical protein C2G38_2208602 [Gigaspora rosea]